MSRHTKLFLTCDDWIYFFDKESAEKKQKEIRNGGGRAEISNDGQFWIVFVFI